MAIGIQTGMRTGSRTPPPTRAQRVARWVRQHRREACVFLSGIGVALVLFALGGDPLERAVRPAVDHVLRGRRYELLCLTEPLGPVLTRRAPRTVVITVYHGEPERLEQARRVAEAVLDPSCRDRVFVRSTDTWLLKAWDLWVGLAGALALTLLLTLARRHRILSGLRERARRLLGRRPRPSPAPPTRREEEGQVADERLRLYVGPSVDLASLALQVDWVREKLWSDLGFRLPPVLLRKQALNDGFWQVWVRDRMVERFCPGSQVAVQAWLARTFKGVAWELVGPQEVQELLEHQELPGVSLLELTVVVRTLLQRGIKLRPLDRILTSVARQRQADPELPVDALVERVSADLGGGR